MLVPLRAEQGSIDRHYQWARGYVYRIKDIKKRVIADIFDAVQLAPAWPHAVLFASGETCASLIKVKHVGFQALIYITSVSNIAIQASATGENTVPSDVIP
jgi:hypothetical protein